MHAEAGDHLAEPLRGARAVHGAGLGGERLHEPGQQLLEAGLAHALDHGAERARRHGAHLGHGVQQRGLEARHDVRQVGQQVLLVREAVHVADDLRGHLARVGAAVEEGALHDGHDERQRGRVDEVHELGVEQRLQAGGGLVRGLLHGGQQHGHDGLDLGVADDGADDLERGAARLLHARVRVAEHVDEARHDAGQAARQLLGRAVGHGAQQLHGAGLGAPVVVVERVEQRRQHQLDAVRAEAAHDELGGVVGGGAHVLRPVAQTQQQVRQRVHHVRLEQPPQRAAQLLQREQRALAVLVVLLLLDGLRQLGHDVQLLQRQDAQPLHHRRDAVRCALKRYTLSSKYRLCRIRSQT